MRGHGAHMWMCAAMVLGVVVIALITGNPLVLIPIVGCVVMMGAMMLMMGDMGNGPHDRS